MSRRQEDLRTGDLPPGANRPAAETEPEQPAEPDQPTSAVDTDRALVDRDSAGRYRDRWMDIQAAFVDEPRQAVAEADGLVAEMIQRLAETFAREREGLEQQWGRGEEVSTEDLRVVMQRYRAFFDRLLTT